MQDNQQGFLVSGFSKPDQDFFLWDQLITSFYCLLRMIVSKVHLPRESDWEVTHEFDFSGNSLRGLG